MNKKWKNITLKISKDKKEKAVFTENAIKIIENKQIKNTINYSEIIEFDACLSVQEKIPLRFRFPLFLNKYKFPKIWDVSLLIYIKTDEIDKYELNLECSLGKAFELVKLNRYINKFNFKTSEDISIKYCITIPLTLYALTGKKFNILGNPYTIIENIIFDITFMPLLFIYIPAYFSGNFNLDNYWFVIFFPVIGIFISILGIINEIKTINLRKLISNDAIPPEKETIRLFGGMKKLIITGNKINIAPAVYKYIHTNRYISLSLFLFNLLLIIFATLKVFYY